MQNEIEALRTDILSKVADFARIKLEADPFIPGITAVPVSGKVLDPEDFVSLVDSSLDGWLTAGRFTEEFERELAKFIGARGSKFVNSGSSANLVALSALTSPKLGPKALKVGDEVVTAGGIMGKVTALKDALVTVEISAGTEVQLQKAAITTVLPKGTLKSA